MRPATPRSPAVPPRWPRPAPPPAISAGPARAPTSRAPPRGQTRFWWRFRTTLGPTQERQRARRSEHEAGRHGPCAAATSQGLRQSPRERRGAWYGLAAWRTILPPRPWRPRPCQLHRRVRLPPAPPPPPRVSEPAPAPAPGAGPEATPRLAAWVTAGRAGAATAPHSAASSARAWRARPRRALAPLPRPPPAPPGRPCPALCAAPPGSTPAA
mmetsp:Transcript_7036/g.16937  ORF Transcript_7036/g.16937 Transcript_7036/m.16937 type:complete len:213 (+) Transcript_7036:735-1373(+)